MRTTPTRRATALSTESGGLMTKAVERRLTTLNEQPQYDTKVGTIPTPIAAPNVSLTDGDSQAFRHLAHSIVSRTLAHECEFRLLGCPEPDSKEWKLLKRREDLSVYRKRKATSTTTTTTTNTTKTTTSKTYIVKCVGTLDGLLEDVLYGTHSKTRDEMHATAAYLHSSHMDCAVLNVLEQGSDDDPFRLLTLKWFLSETFGDARLVKHRDWFNIESTGIGVDARGRRYGYYLSKFIDHPGCPPMPEDSDVIRGKMAMCCIYRQNPGAKVIQVYAKGSIDLGGGIPAFITSSASCSMMFSMAVAMESAEGKRLTKLALQYAEKRAKGIETKATNPTESELELSQNDTTDSALDLNAASLNSSYIASTSHEKMSSPKVPRGPCHVCDRRPAMSKLVRSSHRACGICHQRTCTKCNIKRKLVGQHGPVSVICCKVCILESKRLDIDPRDACPILLID